MRSFQRLCAVALAVAAACTAAPPPPTPAPEPSPPVAEPSPSPSARPSVVRTATPAPVRTPPPPGPCDGRDPRAYVFEIERAELVDLCRTVTGVVTRAEHGQDGTWDLRLRADYGAPTLINIVNALRFDGDLVVKVVCVAPVALPAAASACGTYKNALSVPAVGAHVTVIGPLQRDIAGGWNAIVPAYAVIAAPGSPVPPPATVIQTQALWSEIRAQWPIIPPAIVTATGGESATLSASLYPDGLAHLTVPSSALDTHAVWHEAGHILHAAALQARGQLDLLYQSGDPVGLAFWKTRGFPGEWGATLTGSWASLGYEAIAEAFAAVNLGDAERTVTYGLPLDRTAIRAFFTSLPTR